MKRLAKNIRASRIIVERFEMCNQFDLAFSEIVNPPKEYNLKKHPYELILI